MSKTKTKTEAKAKVKTLSKKKDMKNKKRDFKGLQVISKEKFRQTVNEITVGKIDISNLKALKDGTFYWEESKISID